MKCKCKCTSIVEFTSTITNQVTTVPSPTTSTVSRGGLSPTTRAILSGVSMQGSTIYKATISGKFFYMCMTVCVSKY